MLLYKQIKALKGKFPLENGKRFYQPKRCEVINTEAVETVQ